MFKNQVIVIKNIDLRKYTNFNCPGVLHVAAAVWPCIFLFCRVFFYSFSCCCLRNFPKIRTYSSSRSSKVIDLGVNRQSKAHNYYATVRLPRIYNFNRKEHL